MAFAIDKSPLTKNIPGKVSTAETQIFVLKVRKTDLQLDTKRYFF